MNLPPSSISRITTIWRMIRASHAEDPEERRDAQTEFFNRYHRAVMKYLVAVLKNEQDAELVFSNFATDFVTGGFSKANPERGKFRFYLKRSLVLAAWNYRCDQRALEKSLDKTRVAHLPAPMGTPFDEAWRQEILTLAEEQLAERHPALHIVFAANRQLAESDLPKLTSEQIAAGLAATLGKASYSGDAYRKDLQRARELFRELVRDQLAESVGSSLQEEIEQEAIELGLHDYVKDEIRSHG